MDAKAHSDLIARHFSNYLYDLQKDGAVVYAGTVKAEVERSLNELTNMNQRCQQYHDSLNEAAAQITTLTDRIRELEAQTDDGS